MLVLSKDYSVITQRLASVSTLMYHGTDAENLSSIFSQGLIPNPKKRVWEEDQSSSFQNPSRAALEGIYLTTNLMTAMSSAGKGKTKQDLIIVVEVESGNLLADEDDFKFSLNSALPGHEWSLFQLYVDWQMLENNTMEEGWRRDETQKALDESQHNFVNSCLSMLKGKTKDGLNSHEEEIARSLLTDGFFTALKRKVSYLDNYYWSRLEDKQGVKPPDKVRAEAEFKRLEDRLTRSLKRLGKPEYRDPQRFNNATARITTPIRFSGKNKITTIIATYYVPGDGTHTKILYPPNKEVPPQLITDWEKAVGKWQPE